MSKMLKAARDIFGSHGYTDIAINMVIDEIDSDPEMRLEAVRTAAMDAVMVAQREFRSQIINGGTPKTYSREMQRRLQQSVVGFFSWPMMNGSRLADATKELLETDAARYQANAEGNARNASFLRAVAAKVGEGQKVKDVFSEEQLTKLMEKAKRQTMTD